MKPLYCALIDLAASKVFWLQGLELMAIHAGVSDCGFSSGIAKVSIYGDVVAIYNMTKGAREYIKSNLTVYEQD